MHSALLAGLHQPELQAQVGSKFEWHNPIVTPGQILSVHLFPSRTPCELTCPLQSNIVKFLLVFYLTEKIQQYKIIFTR